MKNKLIIIGIIIGVLMLFIFINNLGGECGDNICQRAEERKGTCPGDCEAAPSNEKTVCGNVICEQGETLNNCPADCREDEEFQYKVKNITTIRESGKSMDWSAENDLIVFGDIDKGTYYYDVFLMKPGGTNVRCLTCNNRDLPKHNGNPSWHPSAQYIVFTAERADAPDLLDSVAIPGSGTANDLWAVTSDGRNFYRLTDYPLVQPYKSVIHPQFSYDGSKLFWAEKVRRGTSFSGGWVLKVARFVTVPTPRLEDIKTYDPGQNGGFYESHAFSKDDQKIMFSGDLISGQSPVGLDIYEFNLQTGQLKRLTFSSNDWDEHSHWSPDGTKIAWMSSKGFDINWENPPDKNWKKHLATELWIMDKDGSNKKRLTYFNDPSSPHHLGSRRVIVSDSSWAPDGESIIALIAYEDLIGRLRSKMVMIELD